METNLIGAAYDVLANTSMWAYGDHLVVSYVAVQRARNFQRISDLLQRLWTFSVAPDGATHQVTPYLDLRAQIYDGFIIHNFNIYVLPKFERHTGEVMSACGAGIRDLEAYSLLGGGVPVPEHRLSRSLDYVP